LRIFQCYGWEMHVNFFVDPSEPMALDTPELEYRKHD
jgi:hypothetical protein